MISGSNLRTSSDSVSGSERVESGKRRGRTESGSAGSWETKSHEPPLDFFLDSVWCLGWEKIEIRPEQELVVK